MERVKFDECELAEIFQVEDLEKRYEMGWVGTIGGILHYDANGPTQDRSWLIASVDIEEEAN
jgi:hypothetical protein